MSPIEYYNQEIKELFNQFQDGEISGNMFHVQRLAALTKAKEIEKQRIEDAWNSAYGGDSNYTGDEYYNKTFKTE